ncbi:cytochrome c biogenesis CcdA family protein [Paremcibacter congregatus]|uniref:Cytochrome C biogenesis protein n=1 Tax=Paremcibacter congregatus TaxID=2043170 RepID=A0A2G4YPV0_9PROT|nr:cytochrome c biogenesis CcdA family protein [Paremcibacter congregatus]PHZ84351.1 cytochrome C biogenesis protein [Paremcibacter congregatus]QDE28571.1 cytochrome c biogenesis protein CcdA [Paremcibacter congregatus]
MENIDVSYLVALLSGMFSFLSPCVLPLVPAYICFITGNSYQDMQDRDNIDKWAMFWPALAFVLGFSTVFIALGAGASSIQGVLQDYKDVFAKISGVMIVILGVHFTGLIRLSFLYKEARFQTQGEQKGLIGAYVIGLAFAFGWTPCIGPILATILTLAATQEHFSQGVALLAVYSLGLGVPFILASVAINRFLATSARLRRHMRVVEYIIGALLIVTGVAIFTGSLQNLGFYLIEAMPWLANIG